MGGGVSKAFDVRVTATGVGGGVITEVIEFRGRPSMRQLHQTIEARMKEGRHVSPHPFKIQCLKVVDESGVWRELRDTLEIHGGQTIRAVQPGEQDSECDIPLKAKAKIVFSQMDSRSKGYIDAADIRDTVRSGFMGIPTSVVYEWFQEADATKTGRVSWRSWVKFSQTYPAVVSQLYSKLQHVRNTAAIDSHLPNYMSSTGTSRIRSGRDFAGNAETTRRHHQPRPLSSPPDPPAAATHRGYTEPPSFTAGNRQHRSPSPPAAPHTGAFNHYNTATTTGSSGSSGVCFQPTRPAGERPSFAPCSRAALNALPLEKRIAELHARARAATAAYSAHGIREDHIPAKKPLSSNTPGGSVLAPAYLSYGGAGGAGRERARSPSPSGVFASSIKRAASPPHPALFQTPEAPDIPLGSAAADAHGGVGGSWAVPKSRPTSPFGCSSPGRGRRRRWWQQ